MCLFVMPEVAPLPHKKKRQYILLKNYYLVWNGQLIFIPAGFIFDGASIPAAAWPITYSPFLPQVLLAALLHDWCYATHIMTRLESDMLFKEVCLACHASKGRVFMMYTMLKVFGSFAWKWSEDDKSKIRDLYEKAKLQEDPKELIFLESLIQRWDLDEVA
jgi:hypothetical protein